MAVIVTLHVVFSHVFALTVFLLCLPTFPLTEASSSGFTIDLVDRDSPKSPFYNPSESHSQRMTSALRRSFNRVNRFKTTSKSPNTPVSNVVSVSGEYVMNISIGTPPNWMLAIADTGSAFIWTQCKGCDTCYNQTAPLFDPKSSSTYATVSCGTNICFTLSEFPPACFSVNETCPYSFTYGDGSFSTGDVSMDTISLASTTGNSLSFPKMVFGCGKHNEGISDKRENGIVGLGAGRNSLISQLSSSVDGKFSYCLVPKPTENTSKMNFGANAVVSGDGVVSTPLFSGDPDIYFYLKLEAVSVDNERFIYDSEILDSDGNIVIDSGTMITFFPDELYRSLESAVAKRIKGKRVNDPDQVLNLCYLNNSDFNPPEITMHFTGADIKLNTFNAFIAHPNDTVCFAFAEDNSLPVYGSVTHANFLVGYDLNAKTVSFKPTDCTKH